MDRSLRRKLVAGTVAAATVAGGGAAIAATELGSSSRADNAAIVDDAAKQLGIQPKALDNALKKALEDRIDAAVAAGRLSKAQGDELKQRIESGDFPLFGPLGGGFGHFAPFATVDAAASYLGLSENQLQTQLNDGKTLAQIAKDRGKPVDGLISALTDAAKTRLDKAVAAGRLSKSQEQQILGDLKQRFQDLVNAQLRFRFHEDRDFDGRPGLFGGPPPAFPGPSA